MGTPKTPQSLPWTPPGPAENLENEPLDIENLHFSCPIPIENTKEITENTGFCQPPRFRQNYFKIHRFWALLDRSWETLLFGHKIWTLTTHPESAKFVSKSTDSEPDASRSLQSTQSEAPKKRTETAAIPMEPSERVLCTNKGDRSYARI